MTKVTSKLQSLAQRLRLFDEATARQRARDKTRPPPSEPSAERDWKREDLYSRCKLR